jgi:S1-C subfamily serine protease
MRRVAAGIAALTLTLAGCGDDDGSGGTAATPTPTTKVEVLKTLDGDGGSTAQSEGFDPGRIYAREAPGVVTVIATGLRGDGSGGGGAGLGSGFVISGRGEIATNAHVVTSGTGGAIQPARSVYVRFPDGNQVDARIVGFDPFADVALLRVDPAGLTLRPLPFGSSKRVKVGAPVAAIGSPFGEEQSLSVGVVSATNRSIDSLTGFATTGAIQTDAAINHGNSGGPLLDASGRVLGINSQIQTSSGDGTGVGFAVPAEVVTRSIGQLRADGKVRYAFLGVSSRALYPQVARRFDLPTAKGVWVQSVSTGGPADDAGIRADGPVQQFQEQSWRAGGDIIVAVDGKPVRDDDDLAQSLLPHRPGETVQVTLYRGSAKRTVDVKLGERPLNDPDPG